MHSNAMCLSCYNSVMFLSCCKLSLKTVLTSRAVSNLENITNIRLLFLNAMVKLKLNIRMLP